jgi:threonine aldolase
MQLASKMRFLAAQLEALLVNDLWCQNASHANKMAELLHQALLRFPQVKITQKRMANSVFATLPRKWTEYLQEEFYFYVWNEKTGEVRLMCGYDTEERDVRAFIERLQAAAVNFPEERTKTDQAINKNQ